MAPPTPSPGDRLLYVQEQSERDHLSGRHWRTLRLVAVTVVHVWTDGRLEIEDGGDEPSRFRTMRDGRIPHPTSARPHRLGDRWATPDDTDLVLEQMTRRRTWDEVSDWRKP